MNDFLRADKTVALRALIVFFLLACVIAWGLMPVIGGIAARNGMTSPDLLEAIENGQWRDLPAGFAPAPLLVFALTRVQDFAFTLSAIATALFFFGSPGLSALGRGLHLRRVPAFWYVIALALPVLAYAVAAIVAALATPGALAGPQISGSAIWAILFAPASGILFYLVLRAGLGEEPGLRGFALPLMLVLTTPIRAAFVLGVLWALWHLPVLTGLPVINIAFFVVLNVLLSFLFAWLFISSEGSIWPVALLHAAINAGDRATEAIFPGLAGTNWQLPAYFVLMGAGLIAATALWRLERDE